MEMIHESDFFSLKEYRAAHTRLFIYDNLSCTMRSLCSLDPSRTQDAAISPSGWRFNLDMVEYGMTWYATWP